MQLQALRNYPVVDGCSTLGWYREDVVNFLFGVTTKTDIDVLQLQVDALFQGQDQIISVQSKQTTVMKAIKNQVLRQRHELQQEINVTLSVFTTLEDMVMNSTTQPLLHLLCLDNLLGSLTLLRSHVRHLVHVLDQIVMGHMAACLLSPTKLQNTKRHIKKNVPDCLHLATHTMTSLQT